MNIEVKIHEAKVSPHDNADALEIVNIGDYQSCVRLGDFKDGDRVAYIPEQSVLPDQLIDEMGLTGKLAGPLHNRVRAVRLRGVLSQGLIYKMPDAELDSDVADELGITKYEPPIPIAMAGDVYRTEEPLLKYEIKNIKAYPDLFIEGESIIATEKLHGTWCCIGWINKEPIATSKGMSAKGLAFKLNEPRNNNNIYVRMFRRYEEGMQKVEWGKEWTTFLVLGEIYGKGIQDLKYGLKEPEFRVFDIWIDGGFQNWVTIQMIAKEIGMNHVPLVYKGPFDKSLISEMTSGNSFLAQHLREGIVIKADPPRHDNRSIGHIMLKSVSPDYLLRGGKTTEYN